LAQHYLLVNTSKRQYLSPGAFRDGEALMEFGPSSYGVMLGLAILLADGNDRGDGDLHSKSPIVGSWAGDPIVVAGDYADEGRFVSVELLSMYRHHVAKDPEFLTWLQNRGYTSVESYTPTLHRIAEVMFEDISTHVIQSLCDDTAARKALVEDRHIEIALAWPAGADPWSI